MSAAQQANDRLRSPADNPYGTLHLLPSAPQDLVIEVYWHLADEERRTVDPADSSRLRALNEAYATIFDTSRPADAANTADDQARTRPSPSRRHWFRQREQPEPAGPAPDAYQLLRIDASAPAHVIELAYTFWRLHVRAQGDGVNALTRERLLDAYDSLRDARLGEPREPLVADVAVSDEPEYGAAEAEPSQQNDSHEDYDGAHYAAAATADVVLPGERASPGTPRRNVRLIVVAASAVRFILRLAKKSLFSSVRWARRVLGPRWKSALAWLKRRAVDPFYEYERGKYAPATKAAKSPIGNAEPALAGYEERLAELAAHRVEEAAYRSSPVSQVEEREGASVSRNTWEERSDDHSQIVPTNSQTGCASLIATSDAGGRPFVLPDYRSLTIGTHPGCDLIVPPNSGKKQSIWARVWARNGQFILHVIESTPSILVNGKTVDWTLLEHGDELQFGAITFRFDYPSMPDG